MLLQSPPCLSCLVAMLLFIFGCGGEEFGTPVTVSGKVTNNGEAVANAQVTFVVLEGGLPAEFRSRQTTTDAQGAYSLGEVYPAEYTVMVQALGYDPAEAPADGGGSATPGDDPLAKFGGESPLRAAVSESSTNFDFELSEH